MPDLYDNRISLPKSKILSNPHAVKQPVKRKEIEVAQQYI